MNDYNHRNDWYYEGQISRNLVLYLKDKGYEILKDNSSNPNARGEDIIAVSPQGVREVIEVKGYPTGFYTKGERLGEKNRTNPKLQAKHWFSEGILSCLVNHSKHKASGDFLLALAFPLMERYRELIRKVEDYFTDNNIPFKVYFVDENGKVSIDDFCINKR